MLCAATVAWTPARVGLCVSEQVALPARQPQDHVSRFAGARTGRPAFRLHSLVTSFGRLTRSSHAHGRRASTDLARRWGASHPTTECGRHGQFSPGTYPDKAPDNIPDDARNPDKRVVLACVLE